MPRAATLRHSGHLPDDAVEAVLEPLDRLALGDLVVGADGGLAATTLSDTFTGTGPMAHRT